MALIFPDTSSSRDDLPRGFYPALIVDVDAETSKAGNPMITVTFDLKHQGRMIPRKDFFVITGEKPRKLNWLLEVCGLPPWSSLNEAFDLSDLLGFELEVEYDGQWITGYHPSKD